MEPHRGGAPWRAGGVRLGSPPQLPAFLAAAASASAAAFASAASFSARAGSVTRRNARATLAPPSIVSSTSLRRLRCWVGARTQPSRVCTRRGRAGHAALHGRVDRKTAFPSLWPGSRAGRGVGRSDGHGGRLPQAG